MTNNLDAISFTQFNYGKVLDAMSNDKPMPETDKNENISVFDKDNKKTLTENPVTKNAATKPKEEVKEEKIKETHYLRNFFNGIKNNLYTLMDNIIEHPIKSAAVIGGIALGIAALPLIGIPSGVGVATLAIAYGVTSLIKTGITLVKFFKHKNENNIDLSEKDIYHLGENAVDLALSLPFVPKGLKDITKFSKYGKIGFNKSIMTNIENAQGLKSKLKVLSNTPISSSVDIKIREAIAKNLSPEMMKEIEPLLKLDNRTFAHKIFKKLLKDIPDANMPGGQVKLFIEKTRNCEGGHYTHFGKQIVINSNYIDSMSKADIISTLAHELQHYKQYIAIDKANLYKEVAPCVKRYIKFCEPYSKMPKSEALKHFKEIYHQNFSTFDTLSPEKPTKYVRKLIKANKKYVDMEANHKKYWNNFMEVDARAAEVPTFPVKTVKDAFLAAGKEIRDNNIAMANNAYGFGTKLAIRNIGLLDFISDATCAK